MDMQAFAAELVAQTKDYIYIRPEDGLFILRPNRVHHLNKTAVAILSRLYTNGTVPDVAAVVREVAAGYGVDEERVRSDLNKLLVSIAALLRDEVCGAPAVTSTPFGSHKRELPVLSEIALTYRCQNKCLFCYAESPTRGRQVAEMNTAEVKRVIDRIFDEAHCPTVSFTGGEPTLREDLPELIAYAKSKGMRVNLITNGLRCADPEFVASLKAAGLDSAQVSLEGPSPQVHDAVVQHAGAFAQTTQAVHVLRAAGIHTHTNTTICRSNCEHLLELVDYVADELHSEYFSMNVIISTGTALHHHEEDVTYTEVGGLIEQVQDRAKQKGVKLVWYSPVPYCLFNPVAHGLGSKSCACVDGLLSVAPDGELLPCSSYERGIGNVLRRPFADLWYSRQARYWRKKQFLPPVCQSCEIHHICCGACPLYWETHSGYGELSATAPGANWFDAVAWKAKRTLWGQAYGVGLTRGAQRRSLEGSERQGLERSERRPNGHDADIG
jgi:radical SAM protein with 4Fe4S-binding SPASM domain